MSVYQVNGTIMHYEDISIHLSSNIDSCYYSEDRIVISIKLENKSSSILRINKNTSVTTKNTQAKEIIKINILHNNNLFEYAFLDGKEAMPKGYNLFKKKSLEINDLINFRQLVTKNEAEMITNISATNVDNVNFGVYMLQAQYIKSSNDTIFSNWITVNYLSDYTPN